MSVYQKVLLVEKIYTEIKKRIVSGEYLPGRRLVEAELTEDFNVSRVTLREALRRLIADDLVVLIPNSGIRVRELSYKEIVEIYTVRATVEALAARLAAQLPNNSLNDLTEICSKGAAAVWKKDRMNHRSLNNRFHMELAFVTGNETLIKIIERLNAQIIGNQFISLMSDSDLEISQNSHEEIVEAIFAGDGGKAESLMHGHIRSGLNFILSCVPESVKNRI
ncbi:MAG: GntR family transcriptional regulator [Bacillota bacterium]|nr:GntR family transcriptional regulator [Bacillota bacterium]